LNMWNVQLKSKQGGGSNPSVSPTIYAMSNALSYNSSSIPLSILRADPATGAIQTFYNLVEPSQTCDGSVDQAIFDPPVDNLMHSFALDPASDDVYVTWSAYVCDCSSEHKTKCEDLSKFDFRVGVSRLETSNKDCVLPSNNHAKASWNNCTTVVATLDSGCSFNNTNAALGGDCIDPTTNTAVTLSQSGFAVARSEVTGDPQFFVSMVNTSFPSMSVPTMSSKNEVWVINKGGSPKTTQKSIDPVAVNQDLIPLNIQDTGSIQLRLDEKSLAPVGMCRTAYDAGIFCQDLKAESGSGAELISATNSTVFLSKSQLNETCFIGVDGGASAVPTVATGLAVSWPDTVYFGCFADPSLPGVGNFASVTRDGTVTQVLDDAYPGSILFGVPLTSAASHSTVAFLSAAVAVSSLFLMVDYI